MKTSPGTFVVLGIAALLLPRLASAQALELSSGPDKNTLLELYTSEGCSSCPPAEAWISRLQADPRLWKSLIPVAFHVDYWNNLGWKDRYSSAAATDRQRNYSSQWGSNTVYTPGFVVNGKEWRQWGNASALTTSNPPRVGILKVSLTADGKTDITFRPTQPHTGRLVAHVAILGSDLVSNVRAGENAGRKLEHDFTVERYESVPMKESSGTYKTQLTGTRPTASTQLAAWVSEAGNPSPIQAVGGQVK